MPAATNKAEILAITEKEWGKLAVLIKKFSAAQAVQKHDEDTSVKDIIAHRAHWIDLFLGWFADGQAGREVHIPAKGYKWNQLKAYNANLRASQAGLSWDQACANLTRAHNQLMAFYADHDDAALYSGPMPGGGTNKWTPGRFSEASGASHYRSAAKYLRQVLRDAAA